MLFPLLVLLAAGAPAKSTKTPARPPPAAPVVVDAGVPAPPAPPASPLEQAGEVKEIELDDKRARAVYRIHTAISIPAVVEFPESFTASPACGDCADASKPGQSSALFALQAEPNGNMLVVKPRLYPGLQGDGSNIPASDFVTTITVRLQSLTLTLQVELTEDKKLADPRVRFVLPNRATESRYIVETIAKFKADQEALFANRVESAAAEQLLRTFLEPHECRSSSARAREADLVLELRELCRFGKRVYLRFTIENRSRALFALAAVTAGAGAEKSYSEVETHHLLSLNEIAFQQTADGVASFDLDDQAATKFELRLTEKGGRSRVVALQGFGF